MVDLRETLIEAAAERVCGRVLPQECELWHEHLLCAQQTVDSVLPLIADAIKSLDDHMHNSRTVRHGDDWHRGMQRAARLVRSLLGDTDGDR